MKAKGLSWFLTRESGGGHIFGLILLLAFILIGALVIDILQAERCALTLQRAADAAALGGTYQLNDTRLGWATAKEAVFKVLRQNGIFGDSGELSGGPGAANGASNCDTLSYDPHPDYQCTTYEFPNLTVSIERGLYYQTGAAPNETRAFRSLEGLVSCTDAEECDLVRSDPLSPNEVWAWANAVRVTVKLKRLDTVFARVEPISVPGIDGIERIALAAKDPKGMS